MTSYQNSIMDLLVGDTPKAKFDFLQTILPKTGGGSEDKTFKNYFDDIKVEIADLLKKKGLPEATQDELLFLNNVLSSISRIHSDKISDLEDDLADTQEKLDDAKSSIEDLEDEVPAYTTMEVESNGNIILPLPDNMNDRFIIETFALCIRAGKPNDLLSHLETFAKANGTHNLIS